VQKVEAIPGALERTCGSMTFEGFLALHHFVFDASHQATWATLHAFGYEYDAKEDRLQLAEHFIRPQYVWPLGWWCSFACCVLFLADE
jgi:hypothetical protein